VSGDSRQPFGSLIVPQCKSIVAGRKATYVVFVVGILISNSQPAIAGGVYPGQDRIAACTLRGLILIIKVVLDFSVSDLDKRAARQLSRIAGWFVLY